MIHLATNTRRPREKKRKIFNLVRDYVKERERKRMTFIRRSETRFSNARTVTIIHSEKKKKIMKIY